MYVQACADGWVVHVAGEVDHATAPVLRAALTSEPVTSSRYSTLVVNLTDVGFMSCAGLRVLLEAQRHAAWRHVTLRLAGCTRAVLRLLDLSDSADQLPTHPTVQNALYSDRSADRKRVSASTGGTLRLR